MAWPPPRDVVPERRLLAWGLFCLVMGGYLAYCAAVVALAVERRKQPPISISYVEDDFQLPNIYMCPSSQLAISQLRSECLLGPAKFTTELPAPKNTTSSVLWSGKAVNFAQFGQAPVTISQDAPDSSPCFLFHLQPLRVVSGTSEQVAFLALSFRVDGNGTGAEIIYDESRFTLRFDDITKVDTAPTPRPFDVGGGVPRSDRAGTTAAPESPVTPKPAVSSEDLSPPIPIPGAAVPTVSLGASEPPSAPVYVIPPAPGAPIPSGYKIPPPTSMAGPIKSAGGSASPGYSPQVAGNFYVPLNKGSNVILSTRVFKKLKGPEAVSITGQFTASEIRGARAAASSRFFPTGQTDIILVSIFVESKPMEVITEKDPLDVLNILSSWGGFWQLVALVLAVLYVSTEPSKTVLDIVGLRFLSSLLNRKKNRLRLQGSATELTKHTPDLYA